MHLTLFYILHKQNSSNPFLLVSNKSKKKELRRRREMGFVRTQESKRAELDEFLRLLSLKCAGVYTVTGAKGEGEANRNVSERMVSDKEEEDGERWVCVTSGVSFLGLTIVNHLLDRGYSVRIAVENQDDLERLGLMEEQSRFGGGMRMSSRICAVRATVTEVESLCDAFRGCRGVFHTSAFADPAGVSGYSKSMAELEVKASENVMEACARTPSVTKCVFTSSLLACIWRNNDDNILHDPPLVLDHNSWTEESVCREKKLWYALGKTMAEKTAWRVARENKIKLVTICPGLITGPECLLRNPTPSIAYLKGAQEMYAEGLLAVADIHKVAEAHVCVYEAMGNIASGRYICFDRVIESEEEAVELARKMGISENRIAASNSSITEGSSSRFKLCNEKLSRLMSRHSRCLTKMYA